MLTHSSMDQSGGPTGKALDAARSFMPDDIDPRYAELALHAAHNPSLGEDRSVSLRAVLNRLVDAPPEWSAFATYFIAREFGGGS